MKTKILALILATITLTGYAQIQLVNVGTPGAGNGEPVWQAFTTENGNWTWLGGQLTGISSQFAALPSTYDAIGLADTIGYNVTNYVDWLMVANNYTNDTYLTIVSNNLTTTMATVASFPGSQIQNLTIASNKVNAVFYAWLSRMPQSPGLNLVDGDSSTGNSLQVPVANGSGSWLWTTLANSGTMNFDGGDISSDGSGDIVVGGTGNASFNGEVYASILAGPTLHDTGGSAGGSGQVATSDGSGYWHWTSLPTTLNFDSGYITSDGSGDITAVSFYGKLNDGSYSTGSAGYVAEANGSGQWYWTQRDVVPDSLGHGGTCIHVQASDNGQDMYIHVTSAGVITATTSP